MRQFIDNLPDRTLLWRYMELESFFWMVLESRLRFTYPRSFSDPAEGQFTKATAEEIRSWSGEHARHNMRLIDQASRHWAVLCFHQQRQENELMWTAYGARAGIAVCTTVGRLRQCTQIYNPIIGRVKYRDYVKDKIDWTSPNHIFSKRKEFRAEREVRIAVMPSDSPEWKYDNAGLSVPANLSRLFTRVVLARSHAWMLESLRKLLTSANLGYPVEVSRLAEQPFRLYDERHMTVLVPLSIADKTEVPERVYLDGES